MSFTNFACINGGSNLNAGTRTGNTTEPGTAADLTYASGSWVQSTRVFTVASGDPVADGVAVGDYASVYADGATVTGYIGRVTARTTTTITISSSAIAGTAPTDGTSNRTLKIGGAWAGPSGTDIFPFNFINGNPVNSSTNPVRCNLKNDQTYTISASLAHTTSSVTFQGYSSSYGDGGKATIDANGNAIHVVNVTGARVGLYDLIATNNGASGANAGFNISGANGCVIVRCVAHNIRGNGILTSGTVPIIECEAYNCNKANSSGLGAIHGSSIVVNSIAHDNTTGSNCHGFTGGGVAYVGCIADTNAGSGFLRTSSTWVMLLNCDSYNNTLDGYDHGSGQTAIGWVMNCNFIKNGGWGIRGYTPSFAFPLWLYNNGYGAGTQANGSGTSTGVEVQETGNVTYASNTTPWVDPANGDFRINLAAAKSAGRGAYTQTAASYAGAQGYPDIGAVAALITGGPVNLVSGGLVQ